MSRKWCHMFPFKLGVRQKRSLCINSIKKPTNAHSSYNNLFLICWYIITQRYYLGTQPQLHYYYSVKHRGGKKVNKVGHITSLIFTAPYANQKKEWQSLSICHPVFIYWMFFNISLLLLLRSENKKFLLNKVLITGLGNSSLEALASMNLKSIFLKD